MERVREKVIAKQNGGLVPPLGVHRGRVSTDERLIKDVVVNQGRGMNHLHDGRENGMRRVEASAGLAAEKNQGGAKSLAAKVGAVIDKLLHERESARQLLLENPFRLLEFASDRRVGRCQLAADLFRPHEHGRGHTESPEGTAKTANLRPANMAWIRRGRNKGLWSNSIRRMMLVARLAQVMAGASSRFLL